MIRPALSAILLALAAAACTGAGNGGIRNSAFVPHGPPIVAHHISNIGAGCEAPERTMGLSLEARAGGVFRVTNPSDEPLTLYYDVAGSFGPSQMFVIRYRDGDGALVGSDHACGWWTPKENHSSLIASDRDIRRDRFTVPAHGSFDIGGGIDGIVGFWRIGVTSVKGPCQAQVRLNVYPNSNSWEGAGAVTGWLPASCPRTD